MIAKVAYADLYVLAESNINRATVANTAPTPWEIALNLSSLSNNFRSGI
ncbi:hypothetical protein MARI151_50285 [Maribacter litoralis]|uniref:Uncharacterized protein n=1 Tax=Maribacter litoralis TaxID=2059726 RepID=A0A653UYP9_9FLAO|nr:hypothetical protein MARI151_50285 [Maribacter litoralis]